MGDLAEMRRLGKVNTLMFIFNIYIGDCKTVAAFVMTNQ